MESSRVLHMISHWLAPAINPYFLLIGVLGAAAVFMWAFGMNRRTREGLQPPGPRGLPIIGNLHMLGSLPHHSLAHLSNSYGPLMSLRLGSLPLLMASSPDMAKLILHTHGRIFSGRPENFYVPKIAFNSLNITFCPAGPYWTLMRKLCVTEFFSAKRLEHFQSIRDEELRGLLLSILAAQGSPISIREKLYTAHSKLISRMTLGTRLQELGAASKGLPTIMEVFTAAGMFNVSDYIPWLAWMDLQGLRRRSKKAARAANSLFHEVINRRRASRSPGDPPHDLLDVLLMASLDPKHSHLNIGNEHIRAVLTDMFVGAMDTSAITIEWALAELLANPEKMMILEKEIENIVGCSRLVQESDIPKLPYLQAVVNETLRLHPVSPLLTLRMSMEPCQISNYYIPQNTLVHVNAWAIHRDPNIWSNSLEFCPERFLDSNIDALTQECKFIPFGAGQRGCPRWKLGVLNVQKVLGNLIHTFDLRTIAKPNTREKYGLITRLKDPLIIVPRPKSSNSSFDTST